MTGNVKHSVEFVEGGAPLDRAREGGWPRGTWRSDPEPSKEKAPGGPGPCYFSSSAFSSGRPIAKDKAVASLARDTD